MRLEKSISKNPGRWGLIQVQSIASNQAADLISCSNLIHEGECRQSAHGPLFALGTMRVPGLASSTLWGTPDCEAFAGSRGPCQPGGGRIENVVIIVRCDEAWGVEHVP